MAIAIVPVTIRNIAETGQFILISSQGGINLYLGNNSRANGLNMIMPDVTLDESVSWREFVPTTTLAAERAVGHSLNDAEVSSYWTGKAVSFALDHPGEFVSLVWKKLVYLFLGFENSDNFDIYHQRGLSVIYRILLWKADGVLYFPFGLLFPLTMMGVVVLRKHWRQLLPLYLFVLAYIPTIVLFLVTARHRLPIIPFMIIIAAGGVAYFASEWKQMGGKTKVLTIVLPIVLLLLVNRTYYAAGATNEFQNFYNDGLRYANTGDYSNAELAFSEAYRLDPQSVPLLDNLAFAQFQLGQMESAKRNFQRAIELNPYYARAYNNLGLVILKEGKADSAAMLFNQAIRQFASEPTGAPILAQVYLNLGDAYERLGDTSSASASFERAMDIAPDFAKTYFEASAYFARHEQYQLADTIFEHGLLHGDARAADYFNWGLSLLKRQKFESGVEQMKTALELDPKFYQAAYCVAAGYRDLGAPADSSFKYVNISLQLNPQFQPAIKLLNALNGQQP